MSMYGQRIRELREELGMTQKDLARELHITQKTVSRYELEQREIGSQMILVFCKYFRVSADYLLGIVDD